MTDQGQVYAREMVPRDGKDVASLLTNACGTWTAREVTQVLRRKLSGGVVAMYRHASLKHDAMVGTCLFHVSVPVVEIDYIYMSIPMAQPWLMHDCCTVMFRYIKLGLKGVNCNTILTKVPAPSVSEALLHRIGFLQCLEEIDPRVGVIHHLYWEDTTSHRGACVIERVMAGDSHVMEEV